MARTRMGHGGKVAEALLNDGLKAARDHLCKSGMSFQICTIDAQG